MFLIRGTAALRLLKKIVHKKKKKNLATRPEKKPVDVEEAGNIM